MAFSPSLSRGTGMVNTIDIIRNDMLQSSTARLSSVDYRETPPARRINSVGSLRYLVGVDCTRLVRRREKACYKQTSAQPRYGEGKSGVLFSRE